MSRGGTKQDLDCRLEGDWRACAAQEMRVRVILDFTGSKEQANSWPLMHYKKRLHRFLILSLFLHIINDFI